MKERLMASNGSVQHMDDVPQNIKDLYKTVWEVKQKILIDMSADRGAFICQSQSLNIFMENPSLAKLTSMHFYAWKQGLKTGMYYLRSKAAVDPIKFSLTAGYKEKYSGDKEVMDLVEDEVVVAEGEVCSMDDGCLMCGS
jgi:ribonucleoside-diphosphate reductase alpha chain